MLKPKFRQIKFLLGEISIIIGFIILINNYIGNVDKKIVADGVGYYDYLPSLFIHHDFIRKNDSRPSNPELYDRIDKTGVYVDYGSFKVNKYPCGTALLQMPFFLVTYLTTDREQGELDGYQLPFHSAVFHAALFYLFLSLVFLRKLLNLYRINELIIFVCQVLLVFATSVTHYANAEASFSHVYSLFAITSFLYTSKLFFNGGKSRYFILSCAALGLIFLLRNLNVLIILFLPFLAGSAKELKLGWQHLAGKKSLLVAGFVTFTGVASIMMLTSYFQTGKLLVDTYYNETFDFTDPHLFKILFSYEKGLFIYAPVLMIASLCVIRFIVQRDYYSFFTWTGFFVVLSYILSSWWAWSFGCSYGLRAYVDYYTIFFIPFALALNGLSTPLKILIAGLSFIAVPLNVIQTYQYKEYIFHWMFMDREKYWKVFLKTDKQFRGMVWKERNKLTDHLLEKEISLGDFHIENDSCVLAFSINTYEIDNFDKIKTIQMLADDEFSETDDSRVVVSIVSLDSTYFESYRYFLHFHEKGLNQQQTGLFNFEIERITDQEEKMLLLELTAGKERKQFRNIRLKFYRSDAGK